ncbi:MAG: glycosyltransferase family 4 protein [Elusimicrobia bacterium]|nr:glycosyltransferase family 4 protein [Elusimicrobiota bacterium]
MLPRFSADSGIESILCISPRTLDAESWFSLKLPKVIFEKCNPFSFLRRGLDAQTIKNLDAFKPDIILSTLEKGFKYKGAPIVTLLQNMAPLTGDKAGCGIIEKIKSFARRFESKMAIKNSAAVIAPTNFVRDFIVSGRGGESAKIEVINFGSNLPSESDKPKDILLNLPQGFVFTAGSVENYRGLEDLIKAMPAVKSKIPGIKLCIAGGVRKEAQNYLVNLKKIAERLEVSDNIIWLGNISEKDLSWYYANCSAFVLTSRVESFCFVAVEALAHGCNCISTNNPCLPEVLGGTSLYYDSGDTNGLLSGILEILERSIEEKSKFSDMAKKRALDFSWDNAFLKTIALFEKIVH